MTTTQKTYLHIIQELENQDIDLVMRSLANLAEHRWRNADGVFDDKEYENEFNVFAKF